MDQFQEDWGGRARVRVEERRRRRRREVDESILGSALDRVGEVVCEVERWQQRRRKEAGLLGAVNTIYR